MKKRVLVVDVAPDVAARLKGALQPYATVTLTSSFADARTHLMARTWDLLVTSLRLGAYNGLHLVYLAASSGHPKTRAVVYGTHQDVSLAREVQAVGAFFERRERLVRALPGYVAGALPPHDRRDTARPDRRTAYRGGRRAVDARPADLTEQNG